MSLRRRMATQGHLIVSDKDRYYLEVCTIGIVYYYIVDKDEIRPPWISRRLPMDIERVLKL